MHFTYLASPYSSDDPEVIAYRFEAVCAAAAELMEQGHVVFAPIAHSHPIAQYMDGRALDHEFWMRQDLPILAAAERVVVLKLPGWDKSRGVAAEIAEAERLGMEVEYMDA